MTKNSYRTHDDKKSGLVLIAGAGQGLGASLMQRFSDAGYDAIGLNRSKAPDARTDPSTPQVDLTLMDETNAAVEAAILQFGPPKVVIHNTAHLTIKPFLEMHEGEFELLWRNMVLSAHNLARATMIPLASHASGADHGAFIVSGATASLRGGNKFAAFASAKFALRGLTQALAREFQPQGVHVAHVILDGIIDTQKSRDLHSLDPARMMKPEDIAESYFQLAHQPKSTWTHELDLRPASESF
jgi:NAD(P)-dependent dehydrogenase (short-subunit alcohol dehydrogenase family)